LSSSVVHFDIPDYEDEPESLNLTIFSIMFAGNAGRLLLSAVLFTCEFFKGREGRNMTLSWTKGTLSKN